MSGGSVLLDQVAKATERRRTLVGVVAVVLTTLVFGPGLARVLHAPTPWMMSLALTVLVAGLTGVVLRQRYRPITALSIARRLNHSDPMVEHSADLLVRRVADLSPLAQYQRGRVDHALATLPKSGLTVKGDVGLLLAWSGVMAVLGLLLLLKPMTTASQPRRAVAPAMAVSTGLVSPTLRQARVRITSPRYTSIGSRTTTDLDLEVVEGATIEWTLRPNRPVSAVQILFSDEDTLPLVRNRLGEWVGSATAVRRSRLYRISLLDADRIEFRTEDHRLAVRADQPPTIAIIEPETRTDIRAGSSLHVPMSAVIEDDHGVDLSTLEATITKGQGEGVTFTRRSIPIVPDPTGLRYHHTFDLDAMGLQPGDELYFHIEATDLRTPSPNRSRSETVFLRIPDTAATVATDFAGIALALPPDYFRSQRQIIIDTEQLLTDAPTLTTDVFRDRANGIGMDQGLLRLRYGEFLGDEVEDGAGSPTPDDANATRPVDPNAPPPDPAQAEVHDHDTEENATLLATSVKEKLRSAVQEMWQAELYLRTAEPRTALPYEYRALTLLKEVQQDARAYVKRVGFDPPPLETDRIRLTGDLSALHEWSTPSRSTQDTALADIRAAVLVLNELSAGHPSTDRQRVVLERAGQSLASAAIQRPGLLPALRSLRTMIDRLSVGEQCQECLLPIGSAFRQILPRPLPGGMPGSADRADLGEAYRASLARRRQGRIR